MVDLVYGRGVTDLINEMPFFVSIFKKYIYKSDPYGCHLEINAVK